MRKLARIILVIMIIGSLLMSACATSNSNVKTALTALLNSDNYTSEWIYEEKTLIEGEMKDHNTSGSILIFHNPYRSYASASFDPGNNDGIIFGDYYEFQEGENYKQKTIYKLESGDTKEFNLNRPFNEEWLIAQVKSCLLSEEYVSEQIIDGINVKKYKVLVTPYPFIFYFGVPIDKNNAKTRIFMDEYKECEGYVYINSETGDIERIEFDLSEKMALNKKII